MLKTFIQFAGFPHSGHSIIGALLDANPVVAIANEFNALAYIDQFPESNRTEFIAALSFAAAQNNLKDAWNNTGYSYRFADSDQGNMSNLTAIGYKKGGGTTRLFRKNPETQIQLLKWFPENLVQITVLRNPIQLISASAYRRGCPISNSLITDFLNQLNALGQLRKLNTKSLVVYHEDFVSDPESIMRDVLNHCSLPWTKWYEQNLRGIVWTNPRKRPTPDPIDTSWGQVMKLVNQADVDGIFGRYL
jgi:hypothetical protein